MKQKTLLMEIRNGIGIIGLNRPKVNNALDETLISELTATLRALGDDPAVRVVVLTGSSTCFCAGGDLNWLKRLADLNPAQKKAESLKLANLLQTVDTLKKPTIARVHGPAFGAGVGLIAACDMAVGAYDAEFSLSEVRLGLPPTIVAPYALRAMGERMARRYFLTAETFTAAEAYRIGLLSDITPLEELDERINELLGQLIQGGPGAQALSKDWIRSLTGVPITAETIGESAKRMAAAASSAEGREGIAAFLGKRTPSWFAPPRKTAAAGKAPKPKAPKPKARIGVFKKQKG